MKVSKSTEKRVESASTGLGVIESVEQMDKVESNVYQLKLDRDLQRYKDFRKRNQKKHSKKGKK